MPGRGGYRKPTPTAKNAVSGNGAMSQRTDGNPSAPVAAPGGDYGSRQKIENEVAITGGLPRVQNLPNRQMPNLNVARPTERINESPIEGTAMNGGLGITQEIKTQVDILLDVLELKSSNPALIAQLRNTRNTQKPIIK